jgi:hypothetical protein
MRKTFGGVAGAAFALGSAVLLSGAGASAQTVALLQTPGAPGAAQPAGASADAGEPQGQGVAVRLTLKSAIEMALRNSKDIQVAKLQASVAEHASLVSKARDREPGTPTEFLKRQGDARHRSSISRIRKRFITSRCGDREKSWRSKRVRRRSCWRM